MPALMAKLMFSGMLPVALANFSSPCYALMIPFSLVAAPYSFTTNGYAEGFLREWWDTWVARGDIVEMADGYRLTPKAEATLIERLATIAGPEVNKPA
jgi:hypothetical protein